MADKGVAPGSIIKSTMKDFRGKNPLKCNCPPQDMGQQGEIPGGGGCYN